MNKAKRILRLIGVAAVFWAPLAQAELVVIVSNANGNSALTAEQAEKIFLGKSNAFPDKSASVPIDMPKGAERDAFYEKVTGKSVSQMKAYWSKQVFTGAGSPPKETESGKAVVDLVAKNPNLVGYTDKANVNSAVKVLLTVH